MPHPLNRGVINFRINFASQAKLTRLTYFRDSERGVVPYEIAAPRAAWQVKEPIDDWKEPLASRGIASQAGEILFWKGFVAMSVLGGKRTLAARPTKFDQRSPARHLASHPPSAMLAPGEWAVD